MNIFGYKNISKIIMFTTILIILSNTILISVVYYLNQVSEYEKSIKILKKQNIEKQKQNLREKINNIVSMINYKYNLKELNDNKAEIILWLKSLPFDKDKSDYIFVYKLLNKNGGDKFAKMIINPNREDLIGKYISTKYKDVTGFAFREAFLNDINKYGESIVRYAYKKNKDKIENKISYMYHFKPLNWIIAKGIYIDDIQTEIDDKTLRLKRQLIYQIKLNIFIFILVAFIASILIYIIGKKIQNLIKEQDIKVKNTTKALANFNRKLDKRVKEEIEKNKEQTKILMQKSKFTALGEMISLIAHQWRQPISELNAIILNIKLHHKLKKLDDKMIDKKSNEIENILEYMSKTIDDFRSFFKPDKTKITFNISDAVDSVLKIIDTLIKEQNITIEKNIDKTLSITNYKNELEQVLLNILSNAKDALKHDKIQDSKINIEVYQKDKIYIKISDNAKGIKKDIQDKIFDPYFTTKDETDGTGIGLYMSKIIIEQNMGGVLEVLSDDSGSCFIISF